MKKTLKFIALTAFLTLGITSISVAQISKQDAETFINAHSAKEVQRVSIISFMQYKKSKLVRNGDSFVPATTVMTALETSLFIIDGTGKEMYIPYSQIKSLSYQPESTERYSMIRVDL